MSEDKRHVIVHAADGPKHFDATSIGADGGHAIVADGVRTVAVFAPGAWFAMHFADAGHPEEAPAEKP